MLILASAFLIGIFIVLLLHYAPFYKKEQDLTKRQLRYFLKFHRLLRFLFIATLLLYVAYGVLLFLPNFLESDVHNKFIYKITRNIAGLALLGVIYWLSVIASNVMRASLNSLPNRSARKFSVLMPVFASGIKATVIVILCNSVLKFFPLFFPIPPIQLGIYTTFNRLLLIGAVAWFLFRLIQGLEVILTFQYSPELDESLDSRKTYTHVVIIKRISILILAILTIAAMLMDFERVSLKNS